MGWQVNERSIEEIQSALSKRAARMLTYDEISTERGLPAVYVEPCPCKRGLAIACRCNEPDPFTNPQRRR